MSDKPPLLSNEMMIASLGSALKAIAELQQDIARCKETINTVRKELAKQIFKEIEECTVKDSPFPGFLVLKIVPYNAVKEKFQ